MRGASALLASWRAPEGEAASGKRVASQRSGPALCTIRQKYDDKVLSNAADKCNPIFDAPPAASAAGPCAAPQTVAPSRGARQPHTVLAMAAQWQLHEGALGPRMGALASQINGQMREAALGRRSGATRPNWRAHFCIIRPAGRQTLGTGGCIAVRASPKLVCS